MPRPASRTASIHPFYVMEIVKAAQQLELAGRSVIHMSIGEPDFTAPEPVQEAARAAIAKGATGYSAALGLAELRERIAGHYLASYGIRIDPGRIVVTAGASAALLLSMAALLEPGHEVLMPDPSYPCNRHFVSVFGGRANLLPCGPGSRFQPTADDVRRNWGGSVAGLMLASPSNPTGTSISPDTLRELLDVVQAREGFSVVDEIYQGLSYDRPPTSALSLSDDVVVINSFSKFFSMTGWRLGWLVAPAALLSVFEKLAQNLYICASTVAQRAAVACFDPATLAIYESRRRQFQRRRDYLVPALRDLGLDVPVTPDGAFYVYVDISSFADDSWNFAFDLLNEAGVCVVPGRDFGSHQPHRYVRISYATSLEQLEEAVERIRKFLAFRARPAI